MKKVFILAIALSTFAMSAQGNRSERNEWRINASNMSPEQIADLKTKKMTFIILSKDQNYAISP